MNNGKEFDQNFYMVWNIIEIILTPPRLIHPIKMAWLNIEGFFPSNAFMASARSLHTFNRSKKMNCNYHARLSICR